MHEQDEAIVPELHARDHLMTCGDGNNAMPLSTEDRLAIHELYARYTHTFDSGRAEEWADVFAPDGGFVSLSGRRHGRDVLVEWARATHEADEREGTAVRHFHLTSNVAIDETDDGVHGTAYVVR